MSFKDPFRPLIYIIVSFLITYALYCLIYKRNLPLIGDIDVQGNGTTAPDGFKRPMQAANRSKRSLEDSGKRQDSRPLFILILASTRWSGSTLLSELLSTASRSVLFFEPISYNYKKSGLADSSGVSDYLSNIFRCDFSEGFDQWLRYTYPYNDYYHHPSVGQCLSGWALRECLKNLKLREMCQGARVRITKVVRSRLSWVEDLLNDSSLNLKVIHMTRDPRGSITSMQSLYWFWQPEGICGDLWQDMLAYDRLVERYPSRLTKVTYEELRSHPTETAARINGFLYGKSRVSEDARHYITKKLESSRQENYPSDTSFTPSSSKDRSQSWRWLINGRLLTDIESAPNCRKAIEKYGHNLFGSLDKATDPRIPLRMSDEGPSEEVLQLYK